MTSKTNVFHLVFLTLIPALVACGTHIRSTTLNVSPKPMVPRSPNDVQVFASTRPVAGYVEVAMLQGRQESVYSRDEVPDIIGKLRDEAAAMGCDGLILEGRDDITRGDDDGDWHTFEGFTGTCIMFVDEVAHPGPLPKPQPKR